MTDPNGKRELSYMIKRVNVSIQKRMLVLLIAAVVLLAAMLVRIMWIQTIHGKEYSKNAALQQTKDVVVSSKRGTIYDRNMNELAKSASADTVTISPREIKKAKKTEEVTNGLADILKMDKKDIEKIVSRDSSYEIVKRKIDKSISDALRKKNYPGVTLVEDYKRYYPGGSLAAHVIGFVGTDNQGLSGIEMTYENYLKGLPGRIVTAKNAAGTNMPYKYEKFIDPENGVNIVLTIDEVIQRKAEDCLKKTAEEYDVQNGAACIIMGAKTGEILAMATYPTYDLNKPFTVVSEKEREKIDEEEDDKKKNQMTSDVLNKQWRNKAVVDAYEPGSTFKSMVAAMALEENVVSLNEEFVCTGSLRVADRDISCANTSGHGNETFVKGVHNSCNPVFMTVGARLGTQRFYKYYKAFGFGAKTGFDLPGEALGSFYAMKNFNEVELATSSFGQGFTVTPLQLITAYTAITNDGMMIRPHLIKALSDDNGNIIKNYEPEKIRQVVSKETANTVCKILEGVASEGTSKNAYIDGYRVAGKTGTSEKIPRGNGKYVASFVGFAPADDPEVICLLMFDEPMKGSHMGGQVAAPVFKEIMSDVLVYLQVPSTSAEDNSVKYNYVPDVKGKAKSEAQKSLSDSGFKVKIIGSGENVVSQSPVAGTALGSNAVVILYTENTSDDYVTVPDLYGAYASDANVLLVNADLNMKLSSAAAAAKNLVGNQIPAAGSQVLRGSTVTLEFNYTGNRATDIKTKVESKKKTDESDDEDKPSDEKNDKKTKQDE